MRVISDREVLTESVGEPEVFAVLFDRYAAVMWRYLARRVGSEIADDLLGELFRIAFEHRAGFDPAFTTAAPWLYGIATNLVRRHRRSEDRRLRAIERLGAQRVLSGRTADEIVDTLDAGRLWPRVAAAIRELPSVERDTLLLFAWEELSYADVAAALGIPVGTVRSRLNRARARLRELIVAIGEEQVDAAYSGRPRA